MRNIFHLVSVLILGVTLSACGGSGGGGDSDTEAPIADVSGTWDITETMGSNDCGELPGETDNYEVTVTMNGNDVTVVTPVGTFTGTLDGDQLEWTGSYPEDGGTTTITSMDLTVSSNGSSLSGTTRWRWTDGNTSCSGRTSVVGVRTSAPPVGGGNNIVDSEPNDTPGEAQPVSGSSATITGNVSGNGYTPSGTDPYDAYAFTPSASRTYTITLTPATDDVDLFVYDSGVNLLDSSVNTGTTVDSVMVNMTAGQVYYINVWAFGTSAYTVTIQ